jgi:hypothetical protein
MMKVMKNDFISQQAARDAAGPKPAKKLYSMAALMHGKDFTGKFETSAATYEFTFAPTAAKLINGKLELTGNLSVGRAGRGAKREAKGVQATLLSTQGGLGSVPAAIRVRTRSNEKSLPLTEATDVAGFVGVMYFHLSPINARTLGLTIDLSSVQLNARLFADNDDERQLQVAYADIVTAAYGEKPNLGEAMKIIASLNQIFSHG